MTRRSKREIERALNDLADAPPSNVRDWVRNHLSKQAEARDVAASFTVVDADGEVIDEPDHEGEVCVATTDADFVAGFWVPESDLPDWIDREALPVRV